MIEIQVAMETRGEPVTRRGQALLIAQASGWCPFGHVSYLEPEDEENGIWLLGISGRWWRRLRREGAIEQDTPHGRISAEMP